jgi:thymidylate synthase (FAD)
MMHVSLLQLTPDAANFIGDCAGICYNSKRDRESNVRRAAACKDKGHLATLRFAHATFHVKGISRSCSHQFVRSKHLDFLQQSQRYVKQTDAAFVWPESIKALGDTTELHDLFLGAYQQLLDGGIKKEDARFILPEATATELVVTGNLQAWLDFISLRNTEHAQWEIRAVAKEIERQLHEHIPQIF